MNHILHNINHKLSILSHLFVIFDKEYFFQIKKLYYYQVKLFILA